MTLGRTKASAVNVRDHAVSESHGRFAWDGAVWRFSDVGSSYGSRLNGLPLQIGGAWRTQITIILISALARYSTVGFLNLFSLWCVPPSRRQRTRRCSRATC